MKKGTSVSLLVSAAAMLASTAGWPVGNARKGADVFAEECGDCHSALPGKNKKGPSLKGVLGRKAAAVDDFSGYSDAMKRTDIVWTEEKIEAYIAQPRKMVPGGKMKYDGLDDPAARADVIAYLQTLR